MHDNVPIIDTIASGFVSIVARDIATREIYRPGMLKNVLKDWLDAALKHREMSQAELARQLTLALSRSIPRSAVNKMVLGEREISGAEMLAIAQILGVPSPRPEAVGDEPEITRTKEGLTAIANAGIVEAGAFRSAPDFIDIEEEPTFDLPDPKFPWARQVSFTVAGDSMNRLQPRQILPGDKVICVDFNDLNGRVPLRDGMTVVVERTRDGGHLREWSIKQLEIYEDRMEFHPRSSNPRHKPIVVPVDYQADDGETFRILALVRRISNEIPI